MTVPLVKVRCSTCSGLLGTVVRNGGQFEWTVKHQGFELAGDGGEVLETSCSKCKLDSHDRPYLIPTSELIAAGREAERSRPLKRWARPPTWSEFFHRQVAGEVILNVHPKR